MAKDRPGVSPNVVGAFQGFPWFAEDSAKVNWARFEKYFCLGGTMYLFFLPSLVGLIVIGCITLKDQFQFKVQQ